MSGCRNAPTSAPNGLRRPRKNVSLSAGACRDPVTATDPRKAAILPRKTVRQALPIVLLAEAFGEPRSLRMESILLGAHPGLL
jgi:hypothetical protein